MKICPFDDDPNKSNEIVTLNKSNEIVTLNKSNEIVTPRFVLNMPSGYKEFCTYKELIDFILKNNTKNELWSIYDRVDDNYFF